ncbi:hypothetical protein [Streptomyces chattanoogensis]|uniref:Uncharacterized protein n=1 Tax=Streptomyces chattanoogensis TaxID=66876 RepID=A0A0N1JWM8_9ACTN|nr:hypothetical protein [Streptomyces chattanoogensis]KPC60285.1 hypothetical protein ADL29_30365 [Streptomyces chattanoogensis]
MTDSVFHQTIENLESVLPELEAQERKLRGELDEVVQRVISTRHALEHLRVLTGSAQRRPQASAPDEVTASPSSAEAPALDAADVEGRQVAVEPVVPAQGKAAAEPEKAAPAVPKPRAAASPRTKSGSAAKRAGKKAVSKKEAPAKPKARKKVAAPAAVAPSDAKGAERLVDAALEVLRKSSVPMRPRDINAALGREATAGQIESVRNTLERAAKKDKLVTRAGRGTYAAV